MPSTHLSLHYHIVLSTKERTPFITPEWRERLHTYIGGVADHVHLLIGLRATAQLADVVRDLKACRRDGCMRKSA